MSGLFDEEADADVEPKGNQSTIIETDATPLRVLAGAGTGKTFTMVRKIERLLDELDVAPRRVLALTFTNQAADSMRSKLNARIKPDGLDIDAYTYHSICNSILREYPYHAGLDSNFDITTDADEFELAREALEAVPARFVDPEGTYRNDPHEILLKFISSMKQDSIQPHEIHEYLPEPGVLLELAELGDRLERAARNHVRRRSLAEDGGTAFTDDIGTLTRELKLERAALGDSPLEQDVAGYLDALAASCERMQAQLAAEYDEILTGQHNAAKRIPAVLFSGYGGEGRQMTRKSDFPTGIPKLPFTLIDRLREYITDCQQAADLAHGYEEYERLREERDLIDFDDLIRYTVELLNNEAVAEEIAGQWDYVFCDEFQDTDSIQFELVTALARHNRLFVVGDDDQAIYEWRGADSDNIGAKLTDTYQPALEDETLDLNFRSKQPILDLANNAIQALDGRASDKQLQAFGDKATATDGVAVVDTTPGAETDADEAEHEASQITTTIAGLVRGDFEPVDETYDLGDIAILVRKKRHATPIIDAFEDAGIPFELIGDLAAESVGVETVLAYLRLLATPGDDVSARRVLLMRYRLSEADLYELSHSADRLVDAVREAAPDAYEEPARIEAAKTDFTHLLARRDSFPVQQLYHELLTQTDIEWFLTSKEQRELRGLEEVITDYGSRAAQPSIGPAFIEYLDEHDSLIETTDSEPTEQAEGSTEAVTIMTVHKAKGLDFPVVMMPQLTASQWAPGARNYEALKTRLDTTATPFWKADPVVRDQHEQRRLLHVGITRAEEQLVLFGNAADDAGSGETLSLKYIQNWIADEIAWALDGSEFPIWDCIQSSLPPTAADWTEAIADHAMRDTGAIATYGDEPLAYETAVDTALELADDLLAGTLSGGDPAALGINPDALGMITDTATQRQHSYTSMGAVEECARRHYLDHVVYATEIPPAIRHPTSDDQTTPSGSAGEPTPNQASNREIGILFHETAEAATNQALTTQGEWEDICRQLGPRLDLEPAIEPALACVDRFFQTELASWERLSAERPFTIDIDGYTVVGEIDSLARRPNGDLVVIDYKATSTTKSAGNRQLPLYVMACNELLDEPVTQAGYVYVSEIGPDVDIRTYDETALNDAQASILAGLSEADTSDYTTYTAGDHCRTCSHNGLPCSPLLD